MEQIKKNVYDTGWSLTSSVIPLLMVGFLLRPLLARWLGVADLGVYSLALTIYGFGALAANFGIGVALTKCVAEYQDDKERLYQMTASGFIMSVLFGIVAGIFLYAARGLLAGVFRMPVLTDLLPLLAIALAFSSIHECLLGISNGRRKMGTYAFLETLRVSSMFLSILVLVGLLGLGIKGVMSGIMLSTAATSIIGLFLLKDSLRLDLRNFLKNAKELGAFGGQMLAGNALNVITNGADTVLIGYFLTAADVGYYSAATTVAASLLLFPISVQRITYAATAESWSKNKHQELNRLLSKSMQYSACILLLLGSGIGFFSAEVITALFGAKFMPAILPLYVLLFARVVRGGTLVPVGASLPGAGRPDLSLKITAVSATIGIGLNILLIPPLGLLGAAIATATSLISGAALTLVFIARVLNVRIDIAWYSRAVGIGCASLASYVAATRLINPHLAAGAVLFISAVLIIKILLAEEYEAFSRRAYSLVHRG
ncbi:MAG: flippase [Chloroflexi bacterium]|nr:flippase [Chloroflexota bacterium]